MKRYEYFNKIEGNRFTAEEHAVGMVITKYMDENRSLEVLLDDQKEQVIADTTIHLFQRILKWLQEDVDEEGK